MSRNELIPLFSSIYIHIYISFIRFITSYFSHLPVLVSFLPIFVSCVWSFVISLIPPCITLHNLNVVPLKSIWNFHMLEITWIEFAVLLLILLAIFLITYFGILTHRFILRVLWCSCLWFFFLFPPPSVLTRYLSSGSVFPSPTLRSPAQKHLGILPPTWY